MTFLAKLSWVSCIHSLWGQDLKCWQGYKECTGLTSGGSGSSPGSVAPISVTLAPCSPLSAFPSWRWLHFSDVSRGDLGCTVMIRACKAQIYCSHCAERKFCSCPQFLGWSKAFLSFPLIMIWTDEMSLLCLLAILVILQADTIKVLLAVPLKQRFLQVQPPTLHPSVGKEVQAGWLIQQSL